jgi:hypothetical protein
MATPSEPEGVASQVQQPSALTGLEVAILTSVLSGSGKSVADFGAKGVEALVTYFRNEGPMAHRVLASWMEDSQYCIALQFINMTLHGGYLEQLNVTKPENDFAFRVAMPSRQIAGPTFPGDTSSVKEGMVGQFQWRKEQELLPLYIAPGSVDTVVLRLQDDQGKTLSKAPVVELSYEFSISGGKEAANDQKQNTKRATVRLRKSGPAYLKK